MNDETEKPTTWDLRQSLSKQASDRFDAAHALGREAHRLDLEAYKHDGERRLDLSAQARAKSVQLRAEESTHRQEAHRLSGLANAIPCPGFTPDPEEGDICSDCMDYKCRECDAHDPSVAEFDAVPLCGDCASERYKDDPDLPLGLDPKTFLRGFEEMQN